MFDKLFNIPVDTNPAEPGQDQGMEVDEVINFVPECDYLLWRERAIRAEARVRVLLMILAVLSASAFYFWAFPTNLY